jgi:hypothetical protein
VIHRLPLETQTLYAELLDHLLGLEAERSVGSLAGSFTSKQVKGETYLYYQASLPGGKTRQFYLGRKSPALDRLVVRFARERTAFAADVARVSRLAAQLRAGGAGTTDAASARVLAGLADAGVFAAGGVLVGTHGFMAIGNLLGVKWALGSLRTQDVDVGSNRQVDVDVAVPDAQIDLPAALENLQMGFLPVPALDARQPCTSFKVRGQALRVDLLCPKRGQTDAPIFIPRFNAAAQPLAHLGFLLESPERAVILANTAALVNVPAPARFALHKLLVAQLRPASFAAKAEKDLLQAVQALEVLVEDRPGDLALAWDALEPLGASVRKGIARGLAAVEARTRGLSKRIRQAAGR